jgi:GNAT superfamily N-acetyltransferase
MSETMQITVRPLRPGDGEDLARAWLDAGRYYAELAPETFQVPDADGLAEEFERDARRPGEGDVRRVVAEVNGRVVGAAAGRIEAPAASARYELQRQFSQTRLIVDMIVVEEAFRRSGVGGLLMRELEGWGRQRGAAVALLDTYPESALSRPFFEQQMGYHQRSMRLIKSL